MNVRKSEICIVINDKSQDSTAKQVVIGYVITNLSLNLLVKQNFKSVKLQAKGLIVSCASFTLDFCPQRCRTRWISKITCVLRT